MPELDPLGTLNSRWTSISENCCLEKRFAVRPLGPLYQTPLPSLAKNFLGFLGSSSTPAISCQSPCGDFQGARSPAIISSAGGSLVWLEAVPSNAETQRSVIANVQGMRIGNMVHSLG